MAAALTLNAPTALFLLIACALLLQVSSQLCEPLPHVPYKQHSDTLPRARRCTIGSANDNSSKTFKPVSSHGREDFIAPQTSDSQWLPNLLLALRAIRHALNFSPAILTSFIAMASSTFRNYVWYELIGFGVGRSGAAFIKWGQWASTRPDIFPEELCAVLERLQHSAPEHSYAYTRQAIQAELGEPIDDIFDFFSEKPLASGSIAQVHRAVLRGQEVAVKVRHPNVLEQIQQDFTLIKAFAEFVDSFSALKWINLPESTRQFSGTMASQTRLDIEGRHLVLFNEHFKKWKKVHFPRPIMFTEGVLVESFEHGELLSDFHRRIADQSARGVPMSKADIKLAHFVVTIGEDIYLKMLLQDNLMHADLHPGNVLLQYSLRGQPLSRADIKALTDEDLERVVTDVALVDAGMVASLTYEERTAFIGLLEATGEGDGLQAADYLMLFSSKKNYSHGAREAFRADMQELFGRVCRGYGTDVNMGVVMRGILSLVRKHHITIEANYATLFLNILCLDGMARTILPQYNVLDGASTLLKLHKMGRALKPHPRVHEAVLKLVLPIARWIKRREDESFLARVTER